MSLKKSKSTARSRKRALRQKKNARSSIVKKSLAALTSDEVIAEEKITESSPVVASPLSSRNVSESINRSSIDLADSIVIKNNLDTPQLTSKENYIPALDPSTIFPFSNKPHEARKKTIAEESKRWESFFDPQYTFGSFKHGISKPVNQYFYQGKWPLDQEDIMGMIPKAKKNKSTPNGTPLSSAEENAAVLFPSVPSPTLPDIKQLELHINTNLADEEEIDGNRQIEILPCPSLSQFPKYRKMENESLWKDRLELLKTIQVNGFNKELNDGTQNAPYKESAAARLQRQIKKKAEKIKRETLVDSSTEEEESDVEQGEQQIDDDYHGLQVAIEPFTTLIQFDSIEEETTEKDGLDNLSLATLDDYENISFHAPKEEGDSEKAEIAVEPEIKRKNRPSFLYFACGFLFPPLWIIGALYVPSSNFERTTASKNIDKKWKKYSRNALFIFMLTIITITVLLLVLKPQTVGFRNSSVNGYGEERVVFDEESRQQ